MLTMSLTLRGAQTGLRSCRRGYNYGGGEEERVGEGRRGKGRDASRYYHALGLLMWIVKRSYRAHPPDSDPRVRLNDIKSDSPII